MLILIISAVVFIGLCCGLGSLFFEGKDKEPNAANFCAGFCLLVAVVALSVLAIFIACFSAQDWGIVGVFLSILVAVGVVTLILESNWLWFKRRAMAKYLKDKQTVQQPTKVAAKPTLWRDRVFAWWRTLNTPQQIGLVLFGVFVAWKIASA